MKSDFIVTVNDVLQRLNQVLAQNMRLDNVWIEGEISSLTKHYTGHYYFTLKDANAQIACAMWKSYTAKLGFNVLEGMKVLVQGHLSVYERSGKMQLIVTTMKPQGLGALYLEFEQRKKILAAQGYFEASHKKPKPNYMEDIAIVTGNETAALQDVLKTIRKRWPMSKIHVYPTLVQGMQAPKAIMQALRQADAGGHDVILLVRGGGSFEDLFCFSDEDLVKTIYDLNTYVVTGIGHEIDYTLSDYVSDHRAVTPTAAAQFVTWDQEQVMDYLQQTQQFLTYRMSQMISQNWQKLTYLENHPYLARPLSYLEKVQMELARHKTALLQAGKNYAMQSQKLAAMRTDMVYSMQKLIEQEKNRTKYLESQLNPALLQEKIRMCRQDIERNETSQIQQMRQLLANAKNQLENASSLLLAASPQTILSKGYALIEQNGHTQTTAAGIDCKEPVTITMQDGEMTATIIERRLHV